MRMDALEVPGTGRPEPGRGPVRVLVVDDHVLVRESTAHVLVSAGIVVVGGAGTAEEALAMIPRTRPDVAIVDIRLPGMSGLGLARHVGALFPAVRTLLFSAYADRAYVEQALALGVGGYLLKTVSPQELVEAVGSVRDGGFVMDTAISARSLRGRRPQGRSWPRGPGDSR